MFDGGVQTATLSEVSSKVKNLDTDGRIKRSSQSGVLLVTRIMFTRVSHFRTALEVSSKNGVFQCHSTSARPDHAHSAHRFTLVVEAYFGSRPAACAPRTAARQACFAPRPGLSIHSLLRRRRWPRAGRPIWLPSDGGTHE